MGEIPTAREEHVPEEKIQVPQSLVDNLTVVMKYFSNRSEMEANLRVAMVVMGAVCCANPPEIVIELQPSLPDHTAVTDFLIVSCERNENTPLAFIEVKKPEITTSLTMRSDASAQALREAHILLQNCKSEKQLPFLLTNSILWSFGLAKKRGPHHISLEDHFTLFVSMEHPDVTREKMKQLVTIVRQVLKGQWPLSTTN